jgi:hypothetical protein
MHARIRTINRLRLRSNGSAAAPEPLTLVKASGWRAWPPRLPDQPIFYPVLNEEYATMIARNWNVPASDVGNVTRFRVRRDFLNRYDVHQAGDQTIPGVPDPGRRPPRVQREHRRSHRGRGRIPLTPPPVATKPCVLDTHTPTPAAEDGPGCGPDGNVGGAGHNSRQASPGTARVSTSVGGGVVIRP